MNTNYNTNVAGALKLITINGSVYQIGKDASASEGGILKLLGGNGAFETYKTSVDGAYDAATVYGEISAIKAAIGSDGEDSIADRVEEIEGAIDGFSSSATVADAIDEAAAAAKSTIALASGESYLTLTNSAAADGHIAYTLSTTGIDGAISTAVAAVVNGAPAAFDTLKEISDWITADQTGAAAILADVANKADKVSSATAGNFAGLDANGNLTDSGSKASDFATAAQGALADTAVQDASYVHTDNNYTTAEKNKLAAISATVSNDTLVITTQAAA